MKKFLFIFVFLVLAFGLLRFFLVDIFLLFPQFSERLPEIERIAQEVSSELPLEEVQKEISSPPPLRAVKEAPEAFLTQSGIITWTNIQRGTQGLPQFTENARINQAAALKVQDMFKNQYFGHVSPSGTDAGDLAERVAYEFIAIGENLALGNFADDKTLVQAWMDSPGHRANILSARYTEIGVAVIKGFFEGQSTWIAVQEFGLPLSVCPEPNTALRARIENNETQLEELEKELDAKRSELQRTRPKWGASYNEKVDEYNALVAQYNTLLEATQMLIAEYNDQVSAFNACIAG